MLLLISQQLLWGLWLWMLLLTYMQPCAKVTTIWSLEKSWPVGRVERSCSLIYVDMPLVMLSESHFKGKKKFLYENVQFFWIYDSIVWS